MAVILHQSIDPDDPTAVQGYYDLTLFREMAELLGVVGSRVPEDHLVSATFTFR